jgi:hypothetical protein
LVSGSVSRAAGAENFGDAFKQAFDPRGLGTEVLTAGLVGGLGGVFSPPQVQPMQMVAPGQGGTTGLIERPVQYVDSAGQLRTSYSPSPSSNVVRQSGMSSSYSPSPSSNVVRQSGISKGSLNVQRGLESPFALRPEYRTTSIAQDASNWTSSFYDTAAKWSTPLQSNGNSLFVKPNVYHPGGQMSLLMPGDAGFSPALVAGG